MNHMIFYSYKTDLIQSMEDIFEETKRRFVIVIDEWDSVFHERKEGKNGQKKYLDFLRDWLKDKAYVDLLEPKVYAIVGLVIVRDCIL